MVDAGRTTSESQGPNVKAFNVPYFLGKYRDTSSLHAIQGEALTLGTCLATFVFPYRQSIATWIIITVNKTRVGSS